MAIIKQKRNWNNIPVRIETNNETAEVKVYVDGGFFGGNSDPLFTSEGKGSDWKITSPQNYVFQFNNKNGTRSTQKELERAFFLEGYKTFDNDRAAVLNNPENYSSSRNAVISRQRFYDQRTPRINDPKTGLTIDSKGNPTNLPVTPTRSQVPGASGDAPPPSAADNQGPGTVIGSTNTGDQVQVVDNNEQGSTAVDESNRRESTVTDDTTKPLTDNTVLRYPLANLDGLEEVGISYDYIKIRVLDWKSGLNSVSGGVTSVTERYSQSKSALETIILPMVNNLSSTNGVGWGENNMNIIQLRAAQILQQGLGDVGKNGLSMDVARKTLKNTIQAANDVIKGLTESDNKDAVAAALAGYVVGNASFLTRGSGKVINPNMELLFNGPKLRTFGFQFDFAPRSSEEAKVVRDIIKVLKARSSPSLGSARLFLESPKVFELEYIYNGDSSDEASGSTHPYLNKIKPCALTQVDVNYTPNNKYMTYAEDGSMVATSLRMSFTEIEPIYANDYSSTGHSAGY
jgi:hypothetical protein